ncbi:MAG: hypothetical protein WCT05_10930 [Lentisphaeria bacterium]
MYKTFFALVLMVTGATCVLADQYPVASHWQIRPIMGRTFWHSTRQGTGDPVSVPNIERFPDLKRVLENSAATVYAYKPGMKIKGVGPFFITGERWGRGSYCDKAGARYGSFAKDVISFRPRNTILNADTIKTYAFRSIFANGENQGWKAMPGFPQSIVYDFYGETPELKSVKVFPAVDKERQIHFKVESSLDGNQYLPAGEFHGEASAQGHEITIGKKTVYIRITVLADSRGEAHIMRTQLLGNNDEELMPYIVSASSEAEPLNPKNVSTISEVTDSLKKEYGERFQGFYIGEVCNCFNRNLIEAFRSKPDPFYGMNTWARNGTNFPFRPRSPKNGEETYENIVFALQKMASSYQWQSPGSASEAIFMSSFHTWDHYYCEFGSKMAYRELTATNPERQRLEYMFSRSAARQYGLPWKIYTANSFYCVAEQMREAAKNKEKDGIYKENSPGLNWANTSASFAYRNLLTAFMMGCNFYENECAQWFGNWQLFAGWFNKTYAVDPYPGLSPIGKAHIKAMNFALDLDDRGIPYTPLAFSVDFKHGISFSFGPWAHGGDPSAWAEAGREYKMSIATMETLMPWKPRDFKPHPKFNLMLETDNLRMANSQFGDVFDVLVPNPPSGLVAPEKFSAFKLILLSGKIHFSSELTRRYEEYVRQGGTLIVNCMNLGQGIPEEFAGVKMLPGQSDKTSAAFDRNRHQVAQLDNGDTQEVVKIQLQNGSQVLLSDENENPLFTVKEQGKGAVICCLVPQMLSLGSLKEEHDILNPSHIPPGKLMAGAEYLLKKLHDNALPFQIEGDIQFLLNKISDGWLVTLINNRGLRKLPDGPMEIDDAYTSVVCIMPQPDLEIHDAIELLEKGDNPILEKADGRIRRITASVPPGDVRIIRIPAAPREDYRLLPGRKLYGNLLTAAEP